MKKYLALLLALVMVFGLVACGGNTDAPASDAPASDAPASDAPAADDNVADEITLWTYPIGNWGNEADVKVLTDAFKAETGITVNVEYLAYSDGDDKVNAAITANSAPDLIMEGPERLVTNWGANGYLVDLADMIDDGDKAEINEAVMSACVNAEGAMYEYPLVMTAHCMAINLDAFKAAGADQYVDLETRTWSTEDFKNAVNALYAYYGDTVGAVYCAGQGGDQGTRALVNNLYGGTFTTADHTAYTWDDAKNIQALEELYALDGIAYDASLVGGDEIALFYQGVLKMAFCWNIAQQSNPNSAGTGEGLTMNGEEIVCMTFPTNEGDPKLQGGIWGFGVFNNGDDSKIAAAKKFISYMCDSEHTIDAVKTATYFPVRSTAGGVELGDMWADNAVMNDYQSHIAPYLGDYYQVTTGWAQARTSWWTMLQEVGKGTDVATAVATYVAEANAAAQ